jgi:hypothetical protein
MATRVAAVAEVTAPGIVTPMPDITGSYQALLHRLLTQGETHRRLGARPPEKRGAVEHRLGAVRYKLKGAVFRGICADRRNAYTKRSG